MNKILKTIFLTCTIYLAACMILSPTGCISAAREAVGLCLDVVIPSLFPFFICSGLFVALGMAELAGRFLSRLMRPLFRVSGAGALAVVLGVVSGYPVGAKCAADLYSEGYITKKEAERLTAFCNNSGPLFIIGAVGVGMLTSRETGLLLYGIHVLSALLVGFVFRFYGGRASVAAPACLPPEKTQANLQSIGGALGRVVENSAETMLKVCGFVILFSVFASVLPQNGGSAFAYAALEITGGVKALLETGSLSNVLKLSLASFYLAFSGISVLLQVASVLAPCGLSIKPYLLGKLLQGTFAFVITFCVFTFLPISRDAFAAASLPVILPTAKELFVTALCMAGWCGLSILVMITAAWLYDRYRK